MKTFKVPVLWVALLASFMAAQNTIQAASITTLTFDDQPPGLTGFDVFAAAGVDIFSADSSMGHIHAVFGGFLIESCGCAISGPNIAVGSDRSDFSRPFFHDLEGIFVLPENGSALSATDSVSFQVIGTVPGGTDPWTAGIFGTVGVFPTDPLEVITGTGNALVSFSRPQADITGFFLLRSSRFEGIDNLSFNTPQIPEPSTIMFVGGGLIAMAAVRKRRGRSKKILVDSASMSKFLERARAD